MNFKELAQKLQQIDEGLGPINHEVPKTDDEMLECGEDGMTECGEDKPQPGSVDMNVSLNGYGPDGIRDLMDILKGIEHGGAPDHGHGDHPLMGNKPGAEIKSVMIGDEYENSVEGGSGEEVYGVDAITQTGDDLFSKGEEAPKQAGGGNPMHMKYESLVNHLSSLYEEIKAR